MLNIPRYIVIHGTDCSYRAIDDQFLPCNGWHKDRDFPLSSLGWYVGYQRLITGGVNYKAREDTEEGSHCNQGFDGKVVYQPENKPNWPQGVVSMNFQSLGICVGFDGDIELVRPQEYALLQKQVWEWQDKYQIPNENVFFHRKFNLLKTCPGSLITDQWLADLLHRPLPVPVDIKLNVCLVENTELKKKIEWYNSIWNQILLLLNKIKL